MLERQQLTVREYNKDQKAYASMLNKMYVAAKEGESSEVKTDFFIVQLGECLLIKESSWWIHQCEPNSLHNFFPGTLTEFRATLPSHYLGINEVRCKTLLYHIFGLHIAESAATT